MRLFESFMRNGEYVIFLNVFFHFIFIYFYFVGGDLQFLCVICIYWINIVHIFFCILESFFLFVCKGSRKCAWKVVGRRMRTEETTLKVRT